MLSLEDRFQRSDQCVSWSPSVALSLPAGLQRHERWLCCASSAEKINMHLQNEALHFISIVFQGRDLRTFKI